MTKEWRDGHGPERVTRRRSEIVGRRGEDRGIYGVCAKCWALDDALRRRETKSWDYGPDRGGNAW